MTELSDRVKRELLDVIGSDKEGRVSRHDVWLAMSLMPRTMDILKRRKDTADLASEHPAVAFDVERNGITYFVVPLLRKDGQRMIPP